MVPTQTADPVAALLAWHLAVGCDETLADAPLNRLQAPVPAAPADTPAAPRPSRIAAAPPPPPPAPIALDTGPPTELAASAGTLEALSNAIRSYTGCGLKATAINTVIADGNPHAALMVLGEAPGADEDRQGKPFVGASGQLLDRMLAAIGRDRSQTYISNVVFWRPPGNRQPTPQELQLCLPFVLRHIELVRPKVLMIAGGVAVKAILQRAEGIMKLRGRWFTHQLTDGSSIPVLPTYHPAFLLRSPAQKRDAWRDLIEIQVKLEELDPPRP